MVNASFSGFDINMVRIFQKERQQTTVRVVSTSHILHGLVEKMV